MKKPIKNKVSHNLFKNGQKIWKPVEQYTVQTVNQDLLNASFSFNYTVYSNNTNHWAKSTTEGFPNCFVACSYPATFTDYLHIYLKKVSTIPDNAVISKMTLTMSRSKAEWGPVVQDRIVRFDQNNVAKNNLALTNVNYPPRTSNPKSVTNSYGGDISLWGYPTFKIRIYLI